VHSEQVTARRGGGDPGGAAYHGLVVALAGGADDDPLAGLPRHGNAVLGTVALQPLLDPVSHPQQGELAQSGEVAGPEIVSERSLDAVRRVHVAVHHPTAERLRGHVDKLDLVGAARDLVRQHLVLLNAGDLPRNVPKRLQVLDVQGRDDVDAGVEQFINVLPPLGIAAPGNVGVRKLVD